MTICRLKVKTSMIEIVGEWLLEHAEQPVTSRLLRCLGFTAASLEALMVYVYEDEQPEEEL